MTTVAPNRFAPDQFDRDESEDRVARAIMVDA
jgi:hypothetical protein